MLDTRKRYFTNDEDPHNLEMQAIVVRAKDHRVLTTWTNTGYTLWWQEEDLPIDPLQQW